MDDKITEFPQIRFVGYTDAWEQLEFIDLLDSRDGIRRGPFGSALKKEIFVSESDYVVYEQQNAIYDRWETRYNITKEKFDELHKFGLSEGDFIMSGAGTIGRISRVPKGIKQGVFNQALIRFKINPAITDSDYFLEWIRSESMQRKFTEANPGSAMTNLVPMSEVKTWVVSSPKLEEQKKIGRFFSELTYLITLHQHKLELLIDKKKNLLSKMFPKDGYDVPEIRISEFTDKWGYFKLGELGETYTGLSGKSKDDFGHGEGKFVTYMNVFSNTVANSELIEPVEIDMKQNEVRYGDVFFTTSSETPEEVGMSSVWTENSANTYLNSFCFGYRPKQKLDLYYLAYMLRSSNIRKKISFLAQGISRYNISKKKVMEIEVPIPSLEEQFKIGEYFKHLDNLITLQQRELELLKETKKSLLQKMFI